MTIGNKRNVLPVQGFYNHRRREIYLGKIQSNLKILIAFLFGILLGRFGQSEKRFGSNDHDVRSSVQHLKEVPFRNTSHVNRKTGIAITKQQLLEPFVVPRLTGFSVATIRAGETVELHSHKNMHEFFYVLEGTATFWMGDSHNGKAKSHLVDSGTFAHFVPNSDHGIAVAENSTLKVLIAGVTVGE